MRVRELTQEHIGRRANVDGRRGVLSYGQVPGYGAHVRSWYLITPSPLPQFDEEAVSLQWAGDTEVELVEEHACPKCNGTGEHFDITNADKANAGPLANQCPRCLGRKVVNRVQLGARFGINHAALPDWDDTQPLPAWMCGGREE
jgi:hypothetical protein